MNVDKWDAVEVPFPRFGGMIDDWGEMHRLVFVFEGSTAQPKMGTFALDDPVLEQVSQ